MGESDDDDNNLKSDVRQQCELELKKYITSKTKYPCLASLAQKYLSIQATSAPSERIFSKASRIIEE